MISKSGKWEDYAALYHLRQHTTPKSTAQDGLPGRVSDIASAKPQVAINKEKGLLVAWLLAMWLMAPDRRTYMRWEREQSMWSWLRASPSGTKTQMTLLSPSNCCLSSVSCHWGGKSSELQDASTLLSMWKSCGQAQEDCKPSIFATKSVRVEQQLQQAACPRLRVPKSVVFARDSWLSRREAPALHQEKKTDQHRASWLFRQGCCRIRKASLSSWLKLQAAGLSRRVARTSTGVSAFLGFAHLFQPSSVMKQRSLPGDLSQGLRTPC